MTEHAFVKSVHRKLDSRIKVWKIIDDYHGGVSDALYFGTEGRHLFVEYKFVKELPVRPMTIVKKSELPPLQQEWFQDLKDRGQPVCVVIGYGIPRHYKGYITWEPADTLCGITKADFVRWTLSKDEVCHEINQFVLGEHYERPS
jgi:hypothetical protein